MKVSFHRENRSVRCSIERDDGARLKLRPLGLGRGRLPHDLEHLVVEHLLGLRWGLWGHISAGAMLDTVALISGPKQTYARRKHSRRVLAEHKAELQRAELLVYACTGVWKQGPCWSARQSWMKRMLPQITCYPDRQMLDQVAEELERQARRWDKISAGGSLSFKWALSYT